MAKLLRYMREKDFSKGHEFRGSQSFWAPGHGIEDCHEINTARLIQNRTFMAGIFTNAPSNANRWRFSTYYDETWLQYGQVRVEYYWVQGKTCGKDAARLPVAAKETL